MSQDIPDIPQQVLALIDQPQYRETTGFPVEMGYVYNTLAATGNGNPLFWDSGVAEHLAGARIAPPTMLSVWFRPHYWMPGAEGERTALQAHFDLKRLLALPEAVVSDNECVLGAPVKMGDTLETWQVLRSVSDVKTTRVGTGRFWVIGVETVNQDGEHVGTEIYTFFGFRRGDARPESAQGDNNGS